MLRGVHHGHAEVKCARVEVERAGLKHAVLLAVKVGEVDEVADDPTEVALVAHDAHDRIDLVVLGGQRGIFFY